MARKKWIRGIGVNMTQIELSTRALSVLAKSGWDGSERNIDKDLAELEEEDFSFPPSFAISFLKQYSGIEFEAIDEKISLRSIISFGLEKALEIPCVKSNLAEHEIILNKKLYPIGSMDLFVLSEKDSYERMILLIAETGEIYSSRSYIVNQAGYDDHDFINRVIDGTLLWRSNKELKISYSRYDARLKELRKQELAEERLEKAR
jgi:SUKH-3 immunity protein